MSMQLSKHSADTSSIAFMALDLAMCLVWMNPKEGTLDLAMCLVWMNPKEGPWVWHYDELRPLFCLPCYSPQNKRKLPTSQFNWLTNCIPYHCFNIEEDPQTRIHTHLPHFQAFLVSSFWSLTVPKNWRPGGLAMRLHAHCKGKSDSLRLMR